MFLKFLFNLDDKTYRDTHRPPAAVSAVFLSQLLLVSAREKKVKKKKEMYLDVGFGLALELNSIKKLL